MLFGSFYKNDQKDIDKSGLPYAFVTEGKNSFTDFKLLTNSENFNDIPDEVSNPNFNFYSL